VNIWNFLASCLVRARVRVRVRVRIRVRVRVRVRLLGVVPRLRPLKSLVRHVPVLADRLLVRVTKEVAPS
jgi:hypothetical protein